MGQGLWFGPKRFGIGVGPITWQGWLVMALFVVAVVGVDLFSATGGFK